MKPRWIRNAVGPGLFVGALWALAGCTSVRSTAIATGGTHLAPRSGPVALYALDAPAEAKELGIVEVAGAGEEGNIEALLPIFVQKVAQLGGNAAHVEGVQARYDLVPRANLDSYWNPCPYRGACMNGRMSTMYDEVMTVRMFGRALYVDGLGSTKPLGKPAPGPTGGAR